MEVVPQYECMTKKPKKEKVSSELKELMKEWLMEALDSEFEKVNETLANQIDVSLCGDSKGVILSLYDGCSNPIKETTLEWLVDDFMETNHDWDLVDYYKKMAGDFEKQAKRLRVAAENLGKDE